MVSAMLMLVTVYFSHAVVLICIYLCLAVYVCVACVCVQLFYVVSVWSVKKGKGCQFV